MTQAKLPTESILDYDIVTADTEQCGKTICSWIAGRSGPRVLVCANPHSLVLAEKDPVFKAAIRSADLVVPDGSGIVLASKLLGGGIRARVTGSDVFAVLGRNLNQRTDRTFSYFFLGSTETVLSEMKSRMAEDFPGIHFAGAYSPPFTATFSQKENAEMVAAVNRAAPDVLWVGMTAPKQEKWIFQHKEELKVKFVGAIGAVFDFYTGNVKRSHPVFRKTGLEWLPRLIKDPRRLYDRTMISAPVFLTLIARQRLKNR